MPLRNRIPLVLAAVAAGVVFFTHVDRLWPLADPRLAPGGVDAEAVARRALATAGLDANGFRAAERVWLDAARTDLVANRLGERADDAIRTGLPTLGRRVYLKRRGEVRSFVVDVHPNGDVLGWRETVEDDAAGATLDAASARAIAARAALETLGIDLAAWESRASATVEQIARVDHTFRLERDFPEGALRERLELQVAGDRVVRAERFLVLPDDFRRERRAAEATGQALETLGVLLLAVGAVAAFVLFVRGLGRGAVPLRDASVWPIAVFACLVGTYVLQPAERLIAWEPLWPYWVSAFRAIVLRALQDVWIPLLLLAVCAAGLLADARLGAGRGATLRLAGRGRWLDRGVARASLRGFGVGLLCGGVLTVGFLLLEATVGVRGALQPRGFFLYPLNSALPSVTVLLFFLGVALAEELGYRLFGGSWLLLATGRRWVAILVPAVVYGLTHARLDFLPPGGPDWARVVLLTAVGAVWGWAFLRWDALTVVLSHFTADLFIFNWPLIAAPDTGTRLLAVATTAVPLLPFLLYRVFSPRRPRTRASARSR